jgi:predicted alpha/beta hydrolase
MTELVTFAALDGHTLHGTVHGQPESAHTALLLNSGTGIPKGFYRRFCAHAAAQGFLVLSYDYRGIGESAACPPSESTAVYRDWGQLDVPAAVDFLQALAPQLPIVTVGHSTGGQQLGLSDRVAQIRAALFVAVSTGYWRGMPWRMWWPNWALWHVIVPICGVLFGYFPARRFGLGESLPIGVAREWGDWCLEPNYLAAYFDESGRHRPRDGRPFGPQHFGQARFAIRSVNFEDDPIATKANVPPLLALYTEATLDIWWHRPQDYGVKTIGHLGFFRKEHAAQWQPHLDWLREQAHAAPR